MILYSVTITIEADAESEWVNWMKEVHIPEVLQTGCFIECRMYRVHGVDGNEPAYVMQYQSPSMEEYERYREQFAPALQKDHTDRFAGRFRGARQVLEEVAHVLLRAE
ncbi:MAG TPA: DUF4286 family protein [Chthoniobacterales bacterium]|jgi:hypothetical protein|nr:DUF4286 family protein [Chthoniobacterales bacterium]